MSSIWTIRRSATDIKLSGLCGGVARHWGVDPVLVRVGCVLLALSGGIGIVLYIAGWLLIPIDGKNEAVIHDVLGEQTRRWPREAWIAIVAVCSLIAFGVLAPVIPFGFGPAVILALIWYFGYYKNRQPHQGEPTAALRPGERVEPAPPSPPQFFSYPGPATPFTEAADAWRQRVEEAKRPDPTTLYRGIYDQPAPVHEDVREPVGPASSLPPAHPLGRESVEYNAFVAHPDPVGLYTEIPSTPVARTAPSTLARGATRSAKRLRLVSLLALALTLSGLAVADHQGVTIPLSAYFGAALLVLGVTLVAAAWLGRARGILPAALLLLLATVVTSVGGPVAQQQGWGAQQVAFTDVSQLAAGGHQEFGELNVDLRKLTATTDASYAAHVDMGSLQVEAPKDMNVFINYRVDSGALIVDGKQQQAGSDLSGLVRPTTYDARRHTLTLNLSVDQGVVQVQR